MYTESSRKIFDQIHFHIRRAMSDTMPLHWIMLPRTIFDHELIFVEEGKVALEIDKSRYIAEKNSIILIPPKKIHSFETLGNVRWQQPHIHFDMEINPNLKDAYIPFRIIDQTDPDFSLMRDNYFEKLKLPPVISSSNTFFYDKIKELLYEIIELQASKDPCSILQAKNYLTEIFILIIKESDHNFDLDQNHHEHLYYVTNLMIEQQLKTFFNIHEISEKLNYTPNYISALYKKHFGITPAKMYEKLKMKRAKEYVLQKNISITEIAATLGYVSVNDFSRSFKRYYHVSPMQFRKQKNDLHEHI